MNYLVSLLKQKRQTVYVKMLEVVIMLQQVYWTYLFIYSMFNEQLEYGKMQYLPFFSKLLIESHSYCHIICR